jgi:hypothetical protein
MALIPAGKPPAQPTQAPQPAPSPKPAPPPDGEEVAAKYASEHGGGQK